MCNDAPAGEVAGAERAPEWIPGRAAVVDGADAADGADEVSLATGRIVFIGTPPR
jgi:hypothetical protein